MSESEPKEEDAQDSQNIAESIVPIDKNKTPTKFP